MRAVSPATVSVLISVLSKWECDSDLRAMILRCFAKMVIVLYRATAVERQIDLLTVFQLYLDVILTLLKTRQFERRPFEEKFDLTTNTDTCIDLNAMTAVVENIAYTLSDNQSRLQICNVLIDANYLATLAAIPKRIQKWEFDKQKLATSVVKTIAILRRTAPAVVNILCNSSHIRTLFEGIKTLGKPSDLLIQQCIELAYDADHKEIVFGEIITYLVDWIREMQMNEQVYVAETLLQICSQNLSWYVSYIPNYTPIISPNKFANLFVFSLSAKELYRTVNLSEQFVMC